MCCAGQRSASATMPSDPQEWAGWEKGDTVPARWTRYWLMQCRAGSFYRAIMASTGRRLGSQDAMKSRSAAIMLHRTSGEIIPGISIHTCPLIFTSQRQLVWASLHLHSLVCPPPPSPTGGEKRKLFTKGVHLPGNRFLDFCVSICVQSSQDLKPWDKASIIKAGL